jgi:hypothetical protein
MELSGQLHAPTISTPGNNPGTHLIGGGLGPRAGLDCLEENNHSLITHGFP